MSKKYIVRNCPSFIDFDEQSLFENLCKNGDNCQDCTDCLIKQVVEKCRERTVGFIEEGLIKDEILQLFSIEEVE